MSMSAPGNGARDAGPLSRSQARLAAVQALYQMDLAETDVAAVIEEFKAHRLGPEAENGTAAQADPEHFARVLEGVVAHQREIDPLIDRQLAQGWRLERIDSIVRAILRAAAFELTGAHRHSGPRRHQRVHRRRPRLLRGRRAQGGQRRARPARPQAAARRAARAGVSAVIPALVAGIHPSTRSLVPLPARPATPELPDESVARWIPRTSLGMTTMLLRDDD